MYKCVANGNWGSWSNRRCILTNGVCRRTITRECDSPVPSNGGSTCPGKEMDYFMCPANECGRFLSFT